MIHTSPTTPGQPHGESDAGAANASVVRRIYEDCLTEGKLDLLDALVSPDFVAPDGSQGPPAFRRVAAGLRAGFPDLRYTVEDLFAAGDRVAIRWTLTGTHSGPFRGFPPTHKRVTSVGFAIFQLEDGKVVASWMETDRLGFLEQIGVLPPDLVAKLRPPRGDSQQ